MTGARARRGMLRAEARRIAEERGHFAGVAPCIEARLGAGAVAMVGCGSQHG